MALRPAQYLIADAPAAAGRSPFRVRAQMAIHKLTPAGR
jgi:hypothetical protein